MIPTINPAAQMADGRKVAGTATSAPAQPVSRRSPLAATPAPALFVPPSFCSPPSIRRELSGSSHCQKDIGTAARRALAAQAPAVAHTGTHLIPPIGGIERQKRPGESRK